MKTKLIFAVIAAVTLISGIAASTIQERNSEASTLTLANVEALSRWEFPSSWDDMWTVSYYDGWHHCEAGGAETCPGI